MDFERSDILEPILDHLEANDRNLYWGIQEKVLGQRTALGQGIGSSAAAEVIQSFQKEVSDRAEKIFSEMRRVLYDAYIEDFDNLTEALKAEWNNRMAATAGVAYDFFIKLRQRDLSTPSPIEYVEKIKPKWLGEIELFYTRLHDSQAPRLFLKAGEVFAGNRAARKIFTEAKQSLDIIDTYIGPEVFDMLEVTSPSVRIRIITNTIKGRTENAIKLAFTRFNEQFQNRAQFRLCDPNIDRLHDRFIIVDGIRALHLGHSVKDLGKAESLIDSAELDPHKTRFEELWLRAQPVC